MFKDKQNNGFLKTGLAPVDIFDNLKTVTFGQNGIECFSRISSTNEYAMNMGMKGAKEGFLVIAESQDKGKGRRGRSWKSKKGAGLYFSTIARPVDIPVHMVPRLTLGVGVAICMAIESICHISPGIKWPNDILLNNKKICGILLEMESIGDKVNFVIIGAGINVNHLQEDFPEDIKDTASSLRIFLKHRVSRVKLLCSILENLEKCYAAFIDNRFEDILDIWRSRSITLGNDIKINTFAGDVVRGKALDIASDGSLKIDKDGMIIIVNSGEIIK